MGVAFLSYLLLANIIRGFDLTTCHFRVLSQIFPNIRIGAIGDRYVGSIGTFEAAPERTQEQLIALAETYL